MTVAESVVGADVVNLITTETAAANDNITIAAGGRVHSTLRSVNLTQPIEANYQRDYATLEKLKLNRYADTQINP